MKLIDILVNGLPKVGGWPEGIVALVQNSSGLIYRAGGGFGVMRAALSDDWANAEITREQYESALAATKGQTVKQWKYIKGSEKDFVGAPDWATIRVCVTDISESNYFVSAHSKGGKYMSCDSGRESIITDLHEYTSIIAQREPITAWDGAGLPPVGCECEVMDKHDDNLWHKCRIVAHTHRKGFDAAIFESDPAVSACSAKYFRPIRSEADKKRDAAVFSINYYLYSSDIVISGDIYDAIAGGKIPGVKPED